MRINQLQRNGNVEIESESILAIAEGIPDDEVGLIEFDEGHKCLIFSTVYRPESNHPIRYKHFMWITDVPEAYNDYGTLLKGSQVVKIDTFRDIDGYQRTNVICCLADKYDSAIQVGINLPVNSKGEKYSRVIGSYCNNQPQHMGFFSGKYFMRVVRPDFWIDGFTTDQEFIKGVLETNSLKASIASKKSLMLARLFANLDGHTKSYQMNNFERNLFSACADGKVSDFIGSIEYGELSVNMLNNRW